MTRTTGTLLERTGASRDGTEARQSAPGAPSPLPPAARLTVVSLVAAAAGVAIMTTSGVGFQTEIPPGLFILLVPAGLMVFGRWRWTPAVATLAGLFIFISYFPSGAVVRLLEPGPPQAFIGLWLQFLASLVAAIAGTAATVRGYRRASRAARRP
jgi:hypothetical protein